MKLARALRLLAIAIAIAAAIDPAIPSRRRADAIVSVMAAPGAQDSTLAETVARQLDDRFTVIRAPFPASAATVVAGSALPRSALSSGGSGFALLHDAATPFVAVTRATVAPATALNSRADVDVEVMAEADGADSVDVVLLDGDVALDRAALPVAEQHQRVTLSYVPASTGSARLRVRASLRNVTAHADIVTDVRAVPWNVFFHEARPSWMATFVRRALEQDARFNVTSRTVTSRGLATEFGRPPALADSAAMALFAAIVVGAPEALSSADVATLEQYMRTRGGAVLLLLDRPGRGAYERLANVQQWQTTSGTAQPLAAAVEQLRASQLMSPATMPPLARTVATHATSGAPVIWSIPVGAGTLAVSGALDSWRYRDPGVAAFDAFWTSLIGTLAEASPAPLSLTSSTRVARPGEWVDVTVTSRDAALAPMGSGAVRMIAEASLDSMPVQLWPAGAPGELHGRVRAPDSVGSYTIAASAGSIAASASLVVADDASHAIADGRDVMRAWAASRAGATFDAGSLGELADSIDARLDAPASRELWHPMRSAWWLVPFVTALGLEWLLRRRRGLM
jgi:hypothetical protein